MESRVPHHIPGVSSSLISHHQPLLDSQVPYGRLQHPLTIYPIDQMRSSHVENDYIDSPAVVSKQPVGSQKNGGGGGGGSRRTIAWLGQSQQQQDPSGVAFLGANHNHHHNHQQQQQHGGSGGVGRQDATTHPWISFSGRPSSISSSSSTSSDQRLLDHAAPTPTLDTHHHHPHHHHHLPHQAPPRTLGCFTTAAGAPPPPFSSASSSSNNDDPKVLTTASSSSSICSTSSKSLDFKASNAMAAGGGGVLLQPPPQQQQQVSALGPIPSSPAEKKHLALCCERCGKCRCTECTLPRALPSCWVCNQECLCSARSLVDAATCMCLVRGVFYHCAGEDEDGDEGGSCADRPCSCAPSSHGCCARWSFMAALSAVLPCLLCYLPATGLAKLGQRCYDNARRPGCRCKQQGPGNVAVVGGGKSGGGGVEGKAQDTTEKQQQQQQQQGS